MSHRDFFTFEHDVKFEKERQVAKHIELLNSCKPINHFGDICVTELKIKPDLKEIVDTSLPYLFSAAIEESFGNGVSKQNLLILIKALFGKKNHYEIPPGINSRFYKFSVDVKYSSSRKKTYNTSNRIVTRRSSTENASPHFLLQKKPHVLLKKKSLLLVMISVMIHKADRKSRILPSVTWDNEKIEIESVQKVFKSQILLYESQSQVLKIYSFLR